ncbi:uncharacterized protein LOC113296026 isoform X2 [Papaver somniferum]|uniref:uncharacterized protein LOC113296026 isoform X2 n=1 Tax=Papaver somniferum TaxID=3469 RepID=UPI000E700ED4|nr:uncharacterized protein LOC113296026 isoform X2 [Papaver somniferum]
MYNNSVSINISDDESDDINGKKRARVRRKRKKFGFRGGKNNDFLRRMIKNLLRWWLFLLIIPAIGLLLFEASRMIGTTKPIHDSKTAACLELLPPEALEHLDIPVHGHASSQVKKVIYKSDPDAGNTTVFQRNTDATRYNLFTGNQTLYEREQSFKVSETAEVHCGFYNENGGYRISDEDKAYMQTCKVVVSTCTFGGGDDIYQPIGMSEPSLKKVCYVAFWDEITVATQEAGGKKIGEDNMIEKWRIVVVKDLPFTDQRLNGKIPKMLTHRLFPQARYSIWVDSKSQFRRDPLGVLEALLWRRTSMLAISEHGARSSVYDEGKAVVKKNKATPEEVEIQLEQYRRDGFPDEKRFNGKKALSEASVIVRELTPLTNLFMCLWFNEVVRFTSRDQLSFPYVVRKLNMKNINMFPVCVRKDLVNSMGHKQKAKPLIN